MCFIDGAATAIVMAQGNDGKFRVDGIHIGHKVCKILT